MKSVGREHNLTSAEVFYSNFTLEGYMVNATCGVRIPENANHSAGRSRRLATDRRTSRVIDREVDLTEYPPLLLL
jgi:hypothetical protein